MRSKDVKFKVAVSIAFGIIGFVLNFHAIHFSQFADFKASILLGLIFPLVITLAWGWKFGLLSALLGGCQSMWWVWHSDGYGMLYAVPVFTLWVLWHGIWSDYRLRGNNVHWYHSMYAVELAFRIFSEIGFYTVFRWLVSLNPPPWDSSITWAEVSYTWVNFVVIKHLINAYILLLLCHVLLSLGPVRKFFRLPERQAQRSMTHVVSLCILMGAFLWVVDSVVVHFAFYEGKKPFLTAVTSDLAPRDLFIRNFFFILCLISGLMISKFLSQRQEKEMEIRKLNEELETRVRQRTLKLQETHEELEDFVYSVSHDLRAPLRAINGFTNIIASRYEASLNDEGRHYFDNILQASHRMGELIDDLLKFSRMGRKSFRLQVVSLDEVIEEALHLLKDPIKEKDAKIGLPAELPKVMGDPVLLPRVAGRGKPCQGSGAADSVLHPSPQDGNGPAFSKKHDFGFHENASAHHTRFHRNRFEAL